MSKSTNRYGPVRYSMRTGIDANPSLPTHIKKRFSMIDAVSLEVFKKTYARLKEANKLSIHRIIKGCEGFEEHRAELVAKGILEPAHEDMSDLMDFDA